MGLAGKTQFRIFNQYLSRKGRMKAKGKDISEDEKGSAQSYGNKESLLQL